MKNQYLEIIEFWFAEIDPKQWWIKDEQFDRCVAERFAEVHGAATRGELFAWRSEPLGRLAEIILLDQFSRNIYRDRPLAFAYDGIALVLAQEAVAVGCDRHLSTPQKQVLYLPFMHSESLLIHDIAVDLYRQLGLEQALEFEYAHKKIIEQFGRYPHRNQILGRVSTAEEIEFLTQPRSSF
ncbi:DUF924 family protein [Roseofilum casamattae]|uniref:DUF924 domain-containing protein n=1 Tax=Roseofilum casamattae BLCC-M143 TaxID=3022442 RepID=A0ABT7BXV2_9CYAN|nr:DUF924 family protein [Roseofilum casamattae]MDJ1184016.1 DUF924 domain-containing protein [Roseofilum casamattae BLCC-M143]